MLLSFYFTSKIPFPYPQPQEPKMDFIKIRFGDDFDQLGSKFEKTIEEMFRSVGPMFNCSECSWKPQMDMYETAREIIILAEIAGVRKEDLELEISSKAIKICGRRKDLPEMEKGTYRLAEIQYGHFERFLFLSAPVDTEKVTALYSNGYLKITLPKMLSDKTHKIPITEG